MNENTSNELKSFAEEGFRLCVAALSGDGMALVDLGKFFVNSPFMIKNVMFYDNFRKFLSGMQYDKTLHRKFLEYLNEGDKEYNAKKILTTIDSVDSSLKIDCILNLTKSVSYHYITPRDYSRLCKLVMDMITEDLYYLKHVIPNGSLEEEMIDEFVRNGLMYLDISRNYVFSKMAFDLDKYALSYASDKYNYSEIDAKKYPRKFVPQLTYYQSEKPINSREGDVWISGGDNDKEFNKE